MKGAFIEYTVPGHGLKAGDLIEIATPDNSSQKMIVLEVGLTGGTFRAAPWRWYHALWAGLRGGWRAISNPWGWRL